MLLKPHEKIVFIGDSITDAGRAQPSGEGLFGALGTGYVNLFDGAIQSVYPELGIRTVNKGTSGDTVRDLKKRWQIDVLDQDPQWVAIMIGINDVWRQFDLPWQGENHVSETEYRETLTELVTTTAIRVRGLILATPFYIEPNPTDAMRAKMDVYGSIVRAIASDHSTVYVDTQAALAPVLNHYYPAALAWDRVHPNTIGTMTLARAFLNAIAFDWNHLS